MQARPYASVKTISDQKVTILGQKSRFQAKKLPSNSHFGLESSLYGKMKRVTETLNVMQVIWAHLRLQSAGGIIMLTQG